METSGRAVLRGGLLAVLLTGCGQGPSGDELVSQTRSILAEANPGCPIDATFNGVGEGDADSAYAGIRLETGPEGSRRSTDVEVLISNMRSDRWEVQQRGSTELMAAAHRLCRHRHEQ